MTSWHADWTGLRVVVLGLGVTGFSVADTLAELGADVLVVAKSADEPTRGILDVIGVHLLLAELDDGVPQSSIASEQSSSSSHRGSVRAILSSNGRSPQAFRCGATSSWLAAARQARCSCRVDHGHRNEREDDDRATRGGDAASRRAARGRLRECRGAGSRRHPRSTGFDVLVIELSSFQFHWTTHRISSFASACLNVAEDHLDWHGSAQAYRAAKGRYQNTKVACVFNRDDLVTRELVEEADVVEGCRAVGFGLGLPGPSDFGVVDGIASTGRSSTIGTTRRSRS